MTNLIASAEGGFNVLAVPIGEFIIGTIAFLIVFGVLTKLLLPKIKATLDERERLIEGGLRKAEKAQEESNKMLADYQDQLATAREEASEIRAQAQAEKAGIIAEARTEAQAAAAAVTAQAQAQIEAEKTRAVSELSKYVGSMATDLAGRIVGESLTDDARSKSVVDRFIGELEQTAAETSGAS